MLHVRGVGTMIRPAAHVSQSALPGALALPASQSWQTTAASTCWSGWNLPATQTSHDSGTSVFTVWPLGHTSQSMIPSAPSADDFPPGQSWQLVSAFSEAEPYWPAGQAEHAFALTNGFNSGLDM